MKVPPERGIFEVRVHAGKRAGHRVLLYPPGNSSLVPSAALLSPFTVPPEKLVQGVRVVVRPTTERSADPFAGRRRNIAGCRLEDYPHLLPVRQINRLLQLDRPTA